MPLKTGTCLGSYEVLALIGVGGMGEVYRARDGKLNRDVALKVLPDAFVGDPDRLARFAREAQLLAALNHPCVASIFGIEESNGVHALVLELVEGPTLAERIGEGAIPLAEALPIARQIAEALEAAHEQGIVHRDLKPANIKVRADGSVKVLDFGLAKALDGQAAAKHTPALTSLAGAKHMILGTAAYMSPEQARGRTVDRRADIWAFGCVLYEMLTGDRAFAGDEASDTIAKIIERDPGWETLDRVAPASMSRLIRRCLHKDPRERLRDIGDAQLELREAAESPLREPAGTVSRRRASASRLAAAAAAGLALGAAATYLALQPGASSSAVNGPPDATRLSAEIDLSGVAPLALDAEAASIGYDPTLLALSPNGRTLVYVGLSGGTSRLFARQLDGFEVRELPGTDGAIHPFFSPDGRSVGFLTNDQLKTHSLATGTTATICNVQTGVVATWTADDTVLFVSQEGRQLERVSARGGVPTTISTPREGFQFGRATLDGRHALVSYRLNGISNDYAQILLFDVATGTTRALPLNGYDARFVAPGHVVFARSGRAFAVPFDFERLEVSGEPVQIAADVRMHSLYPHMQLAESASGALVYVPGGDMSVARFTWHSRDGTKETLPLAAGVYGMFDLSDDGRRLAVQAADNRDYILVYDVERNSARRLASTDSAGWPKWSPTGDALAYTTFGENRPYRVLVQELDSDRAPVTVAETESRPTPSTWSQDGKLTYYEFPSNRIALVDLPNGSAVAEPQYFDFSGSNHDVSPDGRWIVYSNVARGLDIRPLPADDRVRRFSEVGVEPLWCRGCDEIIYRIGNRWFGNRVQLSASGVEWEVPRLLLQTEFIDSPGESWALSRDGQRILVLTSTAVASRTKLRVVSHWLPAAIRPE